MNLKFINDVLKTISVSGINQVVFRVKDDGIVVSGIDKDSTVVVFKRFENNGITDKSMGIHKLSTFLDRLELFDLSKVKVEQADKNHYIKSILLKEGRKKISYMFADPMTITAPKEVMEDEIVNVIEIDSADANSMFKASQTLNSNEFFIYTDNGDLVFKVEDSVTGDSYEEIIGKSLNNTNSNFKWSLDKFKKLVKQDLTSSTKTVINIGKNGFLSLTVSNINFLLLPLFSE